MPHFFINSNSKTENKIIAMKMNRYINIEYER